MNTIKVKSAEEYEQAIKMNGKNKIELDFFEVLSNDKDNINIRYESGWEIWEDGEIIAVCASSSPVYIVNKYGTTDNRLMHGYPIN